MISEYSVATSKEGLIDITAQVCHAINKSGVTGGIAIIYCPHSTAGITINENADPDVMRDLIDGFNKAFPNDPEFRHSEGNSTAHLKASTVGSSVTVIVDEGKPVLGTWQGVFFCEFDPPRNRKFFIKVL